MAVAVYSLCAATSILCAVLLARAWMSARTRLLFWSMLCFAVLAANNVLLFVDKLVAKGTDLSLARSVTAFAGVALLLYGMIWETR